MAEVGTSTFDLIRRIEAGDQEAFSPLFLRYRRRLSVIVYYKLGPGLSPFVSVRDILQDTCLRAFRDFRQFRYSGPGSFLRWLSRIADHVVVDQARYANRDKRRHGAQLRFKSEGNPNGPEPVDSRSPDRDLDEREGIRELVRDLDRLPEDYRRVLVLVKIHGLSIAEVAEQIGRSPNAVSILLSRAVGRFRELRQSAGEGDDRG